MGRHESYIIQKILFFRAPLSLSIIVENSLCFTIHDSAAVDSSDDEDNILFI